MHSVRAERTRSCGLYVRWSHFRSMFGLVPWMVGFWDSSDGLPCSSCWSWHPLSRLFLRMVSSRPLLSSVLVALFLLVSLGSPELSSNPYCLFPFVPQ